MSISLSEILVMRDVGWLGCLEMIVLCEFMSPNVSYAISDEVHGQKSRTVSGDNCRRVPAAVRVSESAQLCVLFVTLRLLL